MTDQLIQIYEAWEQEYQILNPPPENTTNRSEKAKWFILLVATIIVSSYHTVSFLLAGSDSVWTPIIAVASVIFVEIGLVSISEDITKRLDVIAMEKLRLRLLFLGLGLLAFVAIGGNVIHTLETQGFFILELIRLVIVLVVGISAPIMAIVVGVMFTSIKDDNAQAYTDWKRERNRQWTRYKNKNDVSISVSVPDRQQTDTPPRLSTSMSTQTDNRQTGSGYRRASSAVDNARQWLLDNPDKIELPLRELADLIPDAGKDSIGKARNQIINERGNN